MAHWTACQFCLLQTLQHMSLKGIVKYSTYMYAYAYRLPPTAYQPTVCTLLTGHAIHSRFISCLPNQRTSSSKWVPPIIVLYKNSVGTASETTKQENKHILSSSIKTKGPCIRGWMSLERFNIESVPCRRHGLWLKGLISIQSCTAENMHVEGDNQVPRSS